MIKRVMLMNTMERRNVPFLLVTVLFLALFKNSHSQDEGVNRQQNVTSESSTSSSLLATNETEKETVLLTETNNSSNQSKEQLLIISFDGFRYDYFDAFQLDNLRSLSRSGVRAKNGMKGIFTTKTFPSHWSIATGMYQQDHGVIGNRFYDPIKEKVFGKKNEQIDKEWFKGEPIWVTAKKCGKKVGIYFWVGSEIDFGSHLNPDEFKKYNQSVPLKDRIDQVIYWLTVSKYDLVMMYWNEPDTSGHTFGTFSTQVNQSLNEIDGQLSRLINALKKENLLENTNIIILSDHGMTNTTTHVTFSSNVTDNVVYSNEGVVSHFWPKNNSEDLVAEYLRNDLARSLADGDNFPLNITSSVTGLTQEDLEDDRFLAGRRLDNLTNSQMNETTSKETSSSSRTTPFYTIYKKEQLPEKWKYKNNERVAPIVVVAQEGVYLQQVIIIIIFLFFSSFYIFLLYLHMSLSLLIRFLHPRTMYALVYRPHLSDVIFAECNPIITSICRETSSLDEFHLLLFFFKTLLIKILFRST